MAFDEQILSIVLDTAEPRIAADRLSIFVTGGASDGVNEHLQWDMPNSDGTVLVDPITYTAMLTPMCYAPSWASARPGILTKSAYNLTSPDKWVDKSYLFDGNVYLHGLTGSSPEPVGTLATFEKNQGFWISYQAYGGGDLYPQLYVIMGTVGLAFYSDSTVKIYKPISDFPDFESEANFHGGGSIAKLEGYRRDKAGLEKTKGQKQAGGGKLNVGPITDILIIPWRTRELLVLSNQGGGFSFTFDDIAKDDPNPTITESNILRWYVPSAQPDVQVAPVSYATAGNLLSYPITLRRPPAASATADGIAYYDLPNYGTPPDVTASVVDVDGVTPFVGDGVKTQCRMNLHLTGTGTNSPWVYGGGAVFAPIIVNTDGADSQDITGYAIEADFSIPESGTDVRFDFTVKNVPEVDALVSKSTILSNRPFVAKLGTIPIFYGRVNKPHFEECPNPEHTTLRFEGRDPTVAFETYEMLDPIPFDTVTLKSAIEFLGTLPGYNVSEMDVEDFDLALPSTGQSSLGDWALIPEVGDKVLTWLQKLWQDYARTAFWGWIVVAGARTFRFRTPETLGITEVATLFETHDDAVAALIAGGMDAPTAALQAYKYVLRTFREDVFPPEANDIRVTGWDARLDRAFQAHWENAASKIPDTAPASRPDDWLGETAGVAVFDPAITDIGTAAYCTAVLRKRLQYPRNVAEWTCEFLLQSDVSPVWRGDCVRVGDRGVYRVLTAKTKFQTEYRLDSEFGKIWRPSTYTGERVGD